MTTGAESGGAPAWGAGFRWAAGRSPCGRPLQCGRRRRICNRSDRARTVHPAWARVPGGSAGRRTPGTGGMGCPVPPGARAGVPVAPLPCTQAVWVGSWQSLVLLLPRALAENGTGACSRASSPLPRLCGVLEARGARSFSGLESSMKAKRLISSWHTSLLRGRCRQAVPPIRTTGAGSIAVVLGVARASSPATLPALRGWGLRRRFGPSPRGDTSVQRAVWRGRGRRGGSLGCRFGPSLGGEGACLDHSRKSGRGGCPSFAQAPDFPLAATPPDSPPLQVGGRGGILKAGSGFVLGSVERLWRNRPSRSRAP